MTPLADILRELGIELHVYADNTQLYLAFQPIDQDSADVAVNTIQRCMVDVKQWILQTVLKWNHDKTEFIVIGLDSREARLISLTSTSMEFKVLCLKYKALVCHQLVLFVT